MRWPDPDPFPVWVRPRKFARRYGPPCETWIVAWVEPETAVRRERGFASRPEAEAWIARIYANPGLAAGERLLQAIRDDRVRRAGDMAAARTLVMKTAPSGPRRRLRPRSPYRYKPPEPARLRGKPTLRRKNGRTHWRVIDDDAEGRRHEKTFRTRREAAQWHEETWRRIITLQGAPPPPAPPPVVPVRAAEDAAKLRQELAEIKELLKGQRQHQRNEHESGPAILRRLLAIERKLDLVEVPAAPRHTRRRPLGA